MVLSTLVGIEPLSSRVLYENFLGTISRAARGLMTAQAYFEDDKRHTRLAGPPGRTPSAICGAYRTPPRKKNGLRKCSPSHGWRYLRWCYKYRQVSIAPRVSRGSLDRLLYSPPISTSFKMSSSGSIDHSDEKKGPIVDVVAHVAVANKEVDTAAQLATGLDELSPEEAARIRKKIDWHILPLMCSESGGFTLLSNQA